jgi:hypothetical protein
MHAACPGDLCSHSSSGTGDDYNAAENEETAEAVSAEIRMLGREGQGSGWGRGEP